MLLFNPTIIRPNNHIEFPRPVITCRVQDSWDFMKLKVPLQDGDNYTGHSRKGTDITIEGRIGSQSGNLKLSEEEMFETLLTLRNALNVEHDSDGFTLSLYLDNSTAQHRYFKKCSTIRFDYDLSDKHLYSYQATLHATDPTLYQGVLV